MLVHFYLSDYIYLTFPNKTNRLSYSLRMGKMISFFIKRVTSMSFDPNPLNIPLVNFSIKQLPEILILISFPVLSHRVNNIRRIGIHCDISILGQIF